MTTDKRFDQEILQTEELIAVLKNEGTRDKRLSILFSDPEVKHFLSSQRGLKSLLQKMKKKELEIVLTLIALGQGPATLSHWQNFEEPLSALYHLAHSLEPIDKCYRSIGGLGGYQRVLLKLLQNRPVNIRSQTILKPSGLHIEEDSAETNHWVRAGIESLPHFGEVYPIGGAADRMSLFDEVTGEPLPQAKLHFEGHTLLEGLIRDVQAREQLYYKLTGKKILTPLAFMTSPEKSNTTHILGILEGAKWFGRPKEYFFLFEQPLVPVVSLEGFFATKNPLDMSMKPGGHGLLWQLMKTEGVFNWFQEHKRKYLLIRQINNPMAGTDKNLLALAGKGAKGKKSFGFLSCPRVVGASEGMNVGLVTKNEDGYTTTITNIEYTDFSHRGLKDEPEFEGSPYSHYPANTNILFAAIAPLKKALQRLPLPGLLINPKGDVTYYDLQGEKKESKGGRLETTMQNIADVMGDFSLEMPESLEQLSTFILFNQRSKTASVTKKSWKEGNSYDETPLGAWRDKQKNWFYLFKEKFNFDLSEFDDPKNPSFSIYLHPSLGPLWSIMAQKIQNGILHPGANLILRISELYMQGLDLQGSFHLRSPNLEGRAYLKNITCRNKGIDPEGGHLYWEGGVSSEEMVEIILHGNAEVWAEDVTFVGSHFFEVPAGHRCRIYQDKNKIKTLVEKITSPSWTWGYGFDFDDSVTLTFKLKEAKLGSTNLMPETSYDTRKS